MRRVVLAAVAAGVTLLLAVTAGVALVVVSSMQVMAPSPAVLGCGGPTLPGDEPSSTEIGTTPVTQVDRGNGRALQLTGEQLDNAATIIAVARSRNVPARGIQIALMTALQESTLRNLSYGDRDSLGLFQQRANWGSAEERMDPAYQAAAFFGGPLGPNHGTPRGLLDIPNWQQKALGEAAQAVQISAFPEAYDKWQTAAASIMTSQGIAATADTLTPGTSGAGGCPAPGGTSTSGTWKAPNGRTGADMVAYAEQYVGKVPYSGACGSAGSPTAGWCCTGFVSYMYRTVLGVELNSPFVSGQLAQAHQIPASEAQAGDLIAWVGHHIGIYDGAGGVIHSPDWGRYLTHAKDYNFTIGGVHPTFYRVNSLGDAPW